MHADSAAVWILQCQHVFRQFSQINSDSEPALQMTSWARHKSLLQPVWEQETPALLAGPSNFVL